MSYFQIDNIQIEWTTILLAAGICVVVLLVWNIYRSIR